MARKKSNKSYKVDTRKRILTRYRGVEPTAEDEKDIALYVGGGYEIKWAKKPVSVDEMREVLKADEEALAEFDRLYGEKKVVNDKGKLELGFHAAVKYYNAWAKEHAEQEEEEEE